MAKAKPILIIGSSIISKALAERLVKSSTREVYIYDPKDESKSKYREYLDLCDKLNLTPLAKEDLWEDHRDDINQSIDYKGYYP